MSASPVDVEIHLGKSSNGRLMTAEEFDSVRDYDERYRYELVHGVVIVTLVPHEAEVDPNEELGRLLRNYQEFHPQGKALDATLTERYVHLPNSRRRADRVVWAGLGRMPDPRVDVPTIVVEFVSRSRRDHLRDYTEKRRDYLALGVHEYWIIDRFQRRMTVCRPTGVEQIVPATDSYFPSLLPGFELPFAKLLALADRWGR